MGNKLYVGNLSYQETEDQLKELFSAAGTVVSARIITDKFSGRSKGFGFVEMENEEQARKAIETLNGTAHLDRTITVDEAKPPREKDFGGGGYGDRPPRRTGGGGFGGSRRF